MFSIPISLSHKSRPIRARLETHFLGQQHLLKESPEVMAVLEYICSEANKLTNCGIYYCRQMLFKAGRFLTRGEIDRELKSNIHFKAMRSASAQQT